MIKICTEISASGVEVTIHRGERLERLSWQPQDSDPDSAFEDLEESLALKDLPDEQYDLIADALEAASGAAKALYDANKPPCETCDGTGVVVDCAACGGSGGGEGYWKCSTCLYGRDPRACPDCQRGH